LGYLTAFFNSRIFRFAFKEYFPELLGDTRELSKVFFETVAVKPVSEQLNITFSELAEQVGQLKKEGKPATQELEKVEMLLANHYQLTERDIMAIQSTEPL
jgi:adenine-specific DNA-methyltransferase